MANKNWLHALGAAVVLLASAGAAAAQTTITFRFNDPEAPQMRQALDEFEKLNPDIKVTMQRVSWAMPRPSSSGRLPSGKRRMSRRSPSSGHAPLAAPVLSGRWTT